jgi:outer membrane protein assembly factor BamB
MVRVFRDERGWSVRELWRSNRLRNANGPTIYRDGFLYGFAGSILVCVNADTQEVTWRERTGAGTVIAVGSRLVLLGQESGEMSIIEMSPESFILRGRLRVLSEGIRAVTGPSFDEGHFYLRNLREIVAVRMR